MEGIRGIHHVSAICGPAQENVDFYHGVLGLRLIKRTVNYDDPATYHLYFGDGVGTPGTVLTFFPYPDAPPGRPGRGHFNATSLSIPREAAAFWVDRLREHDVEMDKPQSRDGRQIIGFRAPDGLCLELVGESDFVPTVPRPHREIPPHRAIGAIRSVTLSLDELEPTQQVLVDILGFEMISERDHRFCFEAGSALIDLTVNAAGLKGRSGHGSVHHVAFWVESEEEQEEFRDRILAGGYPVSSVMDRTYFKSIYFREPGGALFEIATKHPGFLVDESASTLGSDLMLPANLELKRRQIERVLKPLER